MYYSSNSSSCIVNRY